MFQMIICAFFAAIAFAVPFDEIDTAEIAARMPLRTMAEKISAFLPVLGKRAYPQGLVFFLLFVLLFLLLRKRTVQRTFSVSAGILAVVYAFCLLCGECAVRYGSLRQLCSNFPQCFLSIIKFCGYVTAFYPIIRALWDRLDFGKTETAADGLGTVIFEYHAFVLPFIVILLCWLPWLAAFWPGFVPSDGLKQLNNFFGSGNFTDAHPAFSSMLMGWAMMLGRKLGSDNLGLFFYTGPVTVLNAAVMAACFSLFKRLQSPLWLRKLTLLGFALIPIWPNYSYSLLKDSLYMAMFLLFTLQLIAILMDAQGFCSCRRSLIGMLLTMLLLMLSRHEGKYVASVVFLCLLFRKEIRQQSRKLLPLLLIPLCLTEVFNRVIRPALGITDAPAREALTMLFRQTSAVVLSDEESLNEEQSEVLHELFEYEKIADMYSVENADFIKGLFDPYADTSAILRYLKVWVELGLRHPLLYADVFLSSNARSYDPLLPPHRDIYGWFGIEQESYVNKGLFDLHYAEASGSLRSLLTNIADGLPLLPLSGVCYSLGLNVWLFLFCLFNVLRKKKSIVPLLPGLLTLLLVQHSAVNGFFRYFLPILITMPVCAAWSFSPSASFHENSSNEIMTID